MTKKKLSHYLVAWGSGMSLDRQSLHYKGVKAALKDAKRFDRDCPRDAPHRVYAVYLEEVPR